MVPQTYPSQLNLSTGQQEMVVFFLSSVTGLERWRDYIPVKLVTFPGIEGRTDANGFIAVGALPSITGKTAFNDYVPVFIDAAATDAWEVDNSGYIPYGLSGAGTASLSLGFTSTEFLDSRITFTRASTATRFNSLGLLETVAVDKPRFDYNPATKEPLGLLIEESRVNGCLYSNTIYVANWLNSGGVTAAAGGVDIAGVANEATILTYTAAGTRYIGSGINTSLVPHTTSGYIKWVSGAVNHSLLVAGQSAFGGVGGDRLVTINAQTGAFVSSSAEVGTNYTITNVGDGWFRVSGTFTPTTAGVPYNLGYQAGNTAVVQVDAVQTEVGAFPTSYIPTTTVAVTRAVDDAVMTGTNFNSWWNSVEGTMVAEIDRKVIAGYGGISWMISDGTTANRYYISGGQLSIDRGGVNAATVTSAGPVVDGVPHRHAASWINGAQSCSLEGNISGVAGVANPLPVVSQMTLGRSVSGSATSTINGHIRSVRYYPTRLSDATIQALTA